MRITFVSNESVKVHRSTPRCQGLSPSLPCCRGREDERPGVLADLDPPRIGPPDPNPLADMDASGYGPPGSISARGVQIRQGAPNPLADMDRGVQIS